MQHCDLPFYLLLSAVARLALRLLRIMSDSSFASKNNAKIEQGDTTHTKVRSGKNEGEVSNLVLVEAIIAVFLTSASLIKRFDSG